jgi:hypothetical protein
MVDAELDGYYTSVDDLPLWVQTKLSLLMMLSVPPPLNDLVGVGSRLGPYLYWVYK